MQAKYDITCFKKDILSFGIRIETFQIDQFLKYYDVLIEWNSFMNLTAITDFESVLKKHFIDSLSIIKAIPDISQISYSMIDVGTGAGFPGIPLKIAFPNLKIILLDSLQKRVQFLNKVISVLNLRDIKAVHGRAEDFAKPGQMRENFDLCVSRAVANLSTLSEYCLPFVKKNGLFISYKSEKITEEFERAKSAIDLLGGKYENQVEFFLPGSDIYRNLFLIRKEKSTPIKYPRKAGVPSKDPIS